MNDLTAIKTGALENLAPRRLPNGKLYCLELSETEGEQDECTADLEDTLYKSEKDKSRGLAKIIRDVDRLVLARNPCGPFARFFRLDRCKVENTNGD